MGWSLSGGFRGQPGCISAPISAPLGFCRWYYDLDNTVPGSDHLIAYEAGDDFVHYHYFRAPVGRGGLGYELHRHDGMPVHNVLRPLDLSHINLGGRYSNSRSMRETAFRQVSDLHLGEHLTANRGGLSIEKTPR